MASTLIQQQLGKAARVHRTPHAALPWTIPAVAARSWTPGAQLEVASCSSIQASARQRSSRRVVRADATGAGTSAPTVGKGVVITGGTKGIGFAMAREFLKAGDRVLLCGRNEQRLREAVASLQREFGAARVSGAPCDVSNPDSVTQLGEAARRELGTVDVWINNAGEVTAKKLLADVEPGELARVVGTNVLGSLLCCREAIRVMRQQTAAERPVYHIFNLGFSQFGAQFSKSAVTHKATKMALKQLNESLAQELVQEGLPYIGVHNLSPGMVLTDLLLKDSTPVARRFFNALAEEPETVAAALVPQIRSVEGSGNGVDYMSPADAFLRILKGAPQIINGGRFFDKDGNRVTASGERYQANGVREQF